MSETMEENGAVNDRTTGSLLRASVILRCVAGGGRSGVLMAQIVELTGLPRPTVHRVCQMLLDIGWLERLTADKKLILGGELATFALTAQLHHPLEAFAYPILDEISRTIGHPFYLFVRSGNDAVCVVRCESGASIRMLVIDVGTRRPLGMGAGSAAILAALPEPEIEPIIQANWPSLILNTSFEPSKFRDNLRMAAVKGYATHSGMFTRGMSGLGVPVCDVSGYPIAAISTAFITASLDETQQIEIAAAMKDAALKIAARLTTQAHSPPQSMR